MLAAGVNIKPLRAWWGKPCCHCLSDRLCHHGKVHVERLLKGVPGWTWKQKAQFVVSDVHTFTIRVLGQMLHPAWSLTVFVMLLRIFHFRIWEITVVSCCYPIYSTPLRQTLPFRPLMSCHLFIGDGVTQWPGTRTHIVFGKNLSWKKITSAAPAPRSSFFPIASSKQEQSQTLTSGVFHERGQLLMPNAIADATRIHGQNFVK